MGYQNVNPERNQLAASVEPIDVSIGPSEFDDCIPTLR
jgi:hypothetical protein